MRSADEILFRGRQELTNILLLAARPTPRQLAQDIPALPESEIVEISLRNSAYRESLLELAEQLLSGRLPIFGSILDVGAQVRWRRDYLHGIESGTSYFRGIPYLDASKVGDHKYVWEINRHQHLVILAQAFVLRKDPRYLAEICRQLESWSQQNPFQCGINWSSALEVGFRAISWVWILHLVGRDLPKNAYSSLSDSLYRHGLHLAANLSIYFSPNTHLLGEAVALYAVSLTFPGVSQGIQWKTISAAIVEEQLTFQVRSDGSHFEQSMYYHLYALDFFLLFYLIGGRPQSFEPTLLRMAEYLFWLLGRNREIFLCGDDDGGRLFHPYGQRRRFGRSTLATCGFLFDRPEWLGTVNDLAEQAVWWLGPDVLTKAAVKPSTPSGSRHFSESGSVFIQNEHRSLHFDCGPFGYGNAGHSHSDSLSICVAAQGEDLLIDPGTYTYVGDPVQREWFRGSDAHNTVTVDHSNQGAAAGPFRWATKPEVRMNRWRSTSTGGSCRAMCRYNGIEHTRRVLLDQESLLIFDEVSGVAGEHLLEQNWHFGPSESSDLQLSSTSPTDRATSPYSPEYGTLQSGQRARVVAVGNCPIRVATLFHPEARSLTVDDALARLDVDA